MAEKRSQREPLRAQFCKPRKVLTIYGEPRILHAVIILAAIEWQDRKIEHPYVDRALLCDLIFRTNLGMALEMCGKGVRCAVGG